MSNNELKGLNTASEFKDLNVSYACGVFTSWGYLKEVNNSIYVTLHFAINRFVGEDRIHYDLPSNNMSKDNKQRVAFYIDLQLTEMPSTNSDLNKFRFVDDRFNNLHHNKCEYVLGLSYTTKPASVQNRIKEGKPKVTCHYFSMSNETIVSISDKGNYLWTQDSQNTKRVVDVNEILPIISSNIVKIPSHIETRSKAFII